ncbi:FAD-binding oxidoreductase [Paenibacillus pasadenensis]|uniref:FAD/FMN-containing dehydrogenase n=1 Tax=Paenibacillus pasadenensis TaxID=217090 RepID=A0A2N5N1I9_9BACL|nr:MULTISPECIES: FAD-binding oxidoreductase [Paenibacillus]PLT44204.1 FAD/FMN-containing dehydrogenase [Paenibacillus pasadenensis]QGG54733.1 FAD-binding protein [Paenibacillus sp. B01]
MTVKPEWSAGLAGIVGEERLLLGEEQREKLSKDYYWYSPVLEPLLRGKRADGIVQPEAEREVAEVLAYAYRHDIPVTTRGAGTGNYGQAVPLDGGLVLDLSRLDAVLEATDAFVRVQAGVRLGALEKRLREQGKELRIYPSTFMKATVGGFVCGGSGGIGSITYGNLWDGNVLEAVVWTMEESPRRLVVKGAELQAYIHNYGTNGVLTELTLPIAERTEWSQAVAQFDEFEAACRFCYALSLTDSIRKRLVAPVEWPIPSFFKPLVKKLESGAAACLLEVEEGNEAALAALAEAEGGRIGYAVPADRYRQGIGLSDFTWNHTTLWALNADPTLTYLQAGFDPIRFMEQISELKSRFGDELLLHLEFVRSGGTVMPSALPIVRYTTEERLYEIIAFCESIGVGINDPHTYKLESGGRGRLEAMLAAKRANDPKGLLNPGKLQLPVAGSARGDGR